MRDVGCIERPLRAAIVGSGPAGFYAAEALLGSGLHVEVDLLERWPVPYGLVRFGVAPDHPKLKAVTAVFAEIAGHPNLRFFGNVTLGRDVSVADLSALYDAVVVATGAGGDRRLGVPGEELGGVHAARDFVGWYNGEPGFGSLVFDLSQEVAVVVGQGNVAIDVCRVLAKPIDELRRTDIAAYALDALATSRVREIHVVGRRGPAQARFTPKELRELGTLAGWQVVVDARELVLNEASRTELADPAEPYAAKNLALLQQFANAGKASARCIRLRFHCAPVALHGDGCLRAIELREQRLEGPAGAQRAVPTGRRETLEAGLLLRSVGCFGTPLAGLPFDAERGVIPQRDGRVVDDKGDRRPGWYVAGWIKRGPTGVIGTNRACSVETVASLLADVRRFGGPRPGRLGLRSLLEQRRHRSVSFDEWLRIGAAERERGAAAGKPAEKFVRVDDMLATLT